eukprot:2169072-Pleurochrysis_carterae.AAC.2
MHQTACAERYSGSCGHKEEREEFKLWRQSERAGLGSLRARCCAAQACSLQHAGLPNSSTAIL